MEKARLVRLGASAVALLLVNPRPEIPLPLESVIWNVTTGGLLIATLVTAPVGASAAN
ncbi:MAG: hypothetical protein HY661_12395 [Betaproteobacteria bacterium]|nr:hypothetical protein [Betaproteobacteria bacterium]